MRMLKTLEVPSPSENESSSQSLQPKGREHGKQRGSKSPREEPTGYVYRNRAGGGMGAKSGK